jgi:hypothetical protein
MTGRRWGGLLALVWLGACSSEVPQPLHSVWPAAVELPPVAWTDDVTRFGWETVSIRNETFFALDLTRVAIGGDGGYLLELQATEPSTEIDVRGSVSLQLRFAPPVLEDRSLWSTGDYAAELTFTVGGSGVLDYETGEPDLKSRVEVSQVVPITFSIQCDLDGDGFDAAACFGDDCDDTLAAVNPDAAEVCDGADNNCFRGPDEDCD